MKLAEAMASTVMDDRVTTFRRRIFSAAKTSGSSTAKTISVAAKPIALPIVVGAGERFVGGCTTRNRSTSVDILLLQRGGNEIVVGFLQEASLNISYNFDFVNVQSVGCLLHQTQLIWYCYWSAQSKRRFIITFLLCFQSFCGLSVDLYCSVF